jgi:hypothetical protein
MKIDDNEKDAMFFIAGCSTIILLLITAVFTIGWLIIKNIIPHL